MSRTLEQSIVEKLQRLDERHKAEVLDFVEFLVRKSEMPSSPVEWPEIDPMRDLARYLGVKTSFPSDAVEY